MVKLKHFSIPLDFFSQKFTVLHVYKMKHFPICVVFCFLRRQYGRMTEILAVGFIHFMVLVRV